MAGGQYFRLCNLSLTVVARPPAAKTSAPFGGQAGLQTVTRGGQSPLPPLSPTFTDALVDSAATYSNQAVGFSNAFLSAAKDCVTSAAIDILMYMNLMKKYANMGR